MAGMGRRRWLKYQATEAIGFRVSGDPKLSKELPDAIYANVVQMHLGPFDLLMDFGFKGPEDETEAGDEAGTSGFPVVARIAMSHGHAKSMLPILAKMIAEFEKQVGTIPSPGFDQQSKE